MTIPLKDDSTTQATDAGRYTLRSVSRAIDVLDILALSDDGLSVSEVSRQLHTSKSTAFALLQTLVERSLVTSRGDGFQRRYTLGLGLARLGHRALSSVSLRDVAMPHLVRLTKITRLSSRVATMSQGTAIEIGKVDGPHSIRFDLNMGGRERLHCTGIGKAILGRYSDAEVAEVAERTGLPKRTGHTITNVEALLADVARIRKRGYSIDDEEDADGVLCVGAALIDHTGACPGGISVTGLKVGLPQERVLRIGEAVIAAAEAISRDMGAPR